MTKTHRLELRLEEEELIRLRKLAKTRGITVSAYIRQHCLDAAQSIPQKEEEKEESIRCDTMSVQTKTKCIRCIKLKLNKPNCKQCAKLQDST